MPTANDVTNTGIQPRFLYNTSAFDGATVTTNSGLTTLPVTNIQNEIVRRTWRTLGTTQMAWAEFDLGTTQTVDMLGVFGISSNLTAGITIEGNDAASWGSPALSVGLTVPTDADGVMYERALTFAQGTYRYWRLTIQGTNDGTYWEIGRMVAGQYMTPSVPQDLTVQRSIVDPSLIDNADGVQTYSRLKDKYYVYSINQQNLDNSDREKWEAFFRNRGNTKPVMCAFDPTHTYRFNKDTIYGRLVTPIDEALIMMEYGSLSLTFAEQW